MYRWDDDRWDESLSIPFRIPDIPLTCWFSTEPGFFQFLSGFQLGDVGKNLAPGAYVFQFLSGFQQIALKVITLLWSKSLSIPFRIPVPRV